jgi:hypothetical protein
MRCGSVGFLLGAGCVVLAACSSAPGTVPPSGGGGLARIARPGSVSHGSSTQATLAFSIPAYGQPPVTKGKNYISEATTLVRVTVNGKTKLNVQIPSGTLRFSQTFSVPAGTDDFDILLLDEQSRALSLGRGSQTIASGTSATLTIPIGPYAKPVAMALTGTGGHMKLTDSQVTAPGGSVRVAYDCALMTSPNYLGVTGVSGSPLPLALLGNPYAYVKIRDSLRSIAAGPAGTLLFAACGGHCTIGSIDATGTQRTIASVPPVAQLVIGPDGNIWFAGGGEAKTRDHVAIGKVTFAGKVTPVVSTDDTGNASTIAVGPDKKIWFTDGAGIANVTTSGVLTKIATPLTSKPDYGTSLVAGTDGRMYFDDPRYTLCSSKLAGHAKCYGHGVGPNTGQAPLLWFRNRLFFLSAKRLVRTLDPNDSVQNIQSPAHDVIAPVLAVGNTLYGFGGKTSGSQLGLGITAQTFNGTALSNVTYVATSSLKFYDDDATMVAVAGKIWLMANGRLVLFSPR